MYNFLKKIYHKLSNSSFSKVLKPICDFLFICDYKLLCLYSRIMGEKMPTSQEIELMKNNVTVIFKSFERQNRAKQLYKCIQKYYPGIRVIIADDSSKPLKLRDQYLDVIQLPFNCGVSYGLNRAIEKVSTPFLIRLDDDELLTPATKFHKHLIFLQEHPEVDIVAVLYKNHFRPLNLEAVLQQYYVQPMNNAPKNLLIPHMTPIDTTHIVLGKPPQILIARTDIMKKIGYDDNIRMIDHNEFFFRAAGIAVSVVDTTSYVYHGHNVFDKHYNFYRNDYKRDITYIKEKAKRLIQEEKSKNIDN